MQRPNLSFLTLFMLYAVVCLGLISQSACALAQTSSQVAKSPETLTREAEQLMSEADALKRAGQTKEANAKYAAAAEKHKAAAEAYEQLADALLKEKPNNPPNQTPMADNPTQTRQAVQPDPDINAPTPQTAVAQPRDGTQGFPTNKRLEGTWRVMASGAGFSTSQAYTFHSDGTYEFAGGASMSGGISGSGASGNGGWYQINGNQLTLSSDGRPETLEIATPLEGDYQKANPWKLKIGGTIFQNTKGD